MARPRDPAIDERALEATRKVLQDEGYDAVSMAHIADLAEASAPALYRRWPTVAHLVFDATLDSIVAQPEPPDTGSLRGDLQTSIGMLVDAIDQGQRRMMAERFGEMVADPAFAQRVYEESVVPATRTAAMQLWGRALERGEVRGDVDGFEVLLDVACLVVHRHLVLDRRPTGSEVDAIVDRLLRGVAA